jgi:hypothetical protein
VLGGGVLWLPAQLDPGVVWSPLQAGERAVAGAGVAAGGAGVQLREVGPYPTAMGWDAPPPPPSAHPQAGCVVLSGRSCRQEGHHHHQEARRHLGHPGVLIRVRVEIMGSKKCRNVGQSQPVRIMIHLIIPPLPRTCNMRLPVRVEYGCQSRGTASGACTR